MKLEAVIVCIGYSDFLINTLTNNKNFFDRTVVVTDTKDEDTARVCEFCNVMCLKTDIFYDDPNIRKNPNKARGINEGLKHLDKDGWVVQLDADIWLPPLTRHVLQNLPLDEKAIYGIDRLMCDSFTDWMKYIYTGKPLHEGWCYVHTSQFPVGVRIVKYHSEGYLPIGFFQLFNPKGSGVYTYPEVEAAFDRTDVLMCQQWSRENRRFIPDIICIHLASEATFSGQNWYGRKTRPFKPLTLKERAFYAYYKMTFSLKNLFSKDKKEKNHLYKIE